MNTVSFKYDISARWQEQYTQVSTALWGYHTYSVSDGTLFIGKYSEVLVKVESRRESTGGGHSQLRFTLSVLDVGKAVYKYSWAAWEDLMPGEHPGRYEMLAEMRRVLRAHALTFGLMASKLEDEVFEQAGVLIWRYMKSSL